MPETYDVFLSHNSKDKPAVRELAEALRDRGLRVWLDEWALGPGSVWQEALERTIETVRSAVVVVGKAGLGPWGNQEMRGLLDESGRRKLLIVPVLLSGARELPLFLRRFNCLDLRNGTTPEALDRLVQAIREQLPKRRKPAASTPEPPDADLEAFKAWARERIEHVPLIGVGGGDFKLRFDEIYVPLRLAARRQMLEPRAGKKEVHELEEGRNLKLENLFAKRRDGGPHAVVLGHPGAGKTTVLRKIEHLCLNQGPDTLGLPSGTVPLFLRLRQIAREDLEKAPADLLAEQLAAEAGPALPADFGARLWHRGRLLLLLDGLDEIADAALRAAVCHYLAKHLLGAEGRGVIAAVSCRFTGWGGTVALPEPRFRAVEVCPLDAAGCESLVRRWFEELEHAHPDRKAEAQRGRRDLLAALGQADYRTQRLKVLVGSPLLLTLLCLIVLRGRQMPRHRWAFYDECLRVLLEQWSHGKAVEDPQRREPPLDVETALSVLRAVAWELHTRSSAVDPPRASVVLLLGRRLRQVGAKATGEQVFEWLLREAGMVGELSAGGYGFRHLGLQEYLVALHAASSGEALLEFVAERFGQEGWQEILLLLFGLPGRQLFAPLMERLLAGNRFLTEIDLLRDCLEEAAEVELAPFLAELSAGKPPERQAAVLRLLLGRQDPRLLEAAEALRDSQDRDVRALALQVVAACRRPEGDEAKRELFVLWHREDPCDETAARGFLEVVNGQGLRAASPLEEPGWEGDSDRIVNEHRALALIVGPSGLGPWEEERFQAWPGLFELRDRRVLAVRLPGSGEAPTWLDAEVPVQWVDLRGGLGPAAREFGRVLWPAGEATIELSLSPAIVHADGEAWFEETTGIRFLWVPGGRFRMGGKAKYDGKPIHWVTVSPFWLGETEVTNRQYAEFLEKTGYGEPEYWRDRRFSTPEQPVVGVSWEDAVAFCRWLSEISGQEVQLPSEAQWEFAARGTDGREYPWGNEVPDETRASFGGRENQTSPVGTFPAGKGPFGHLDLAGNVWEWCFDAWDKAAYAKRANGSESVDPVVSEKGEEGRVVRGGAFWLPAERLRAAFRGGDFAGRRLMDRGFRCAAAFPASRLDS